MSKTGKGLITVVCIAVIGLAVFHLTNQGKKKYAKEIIKLNGTFGSYAWLMSTEEGYLKAWANALAKGKASFSFNNENYNTSGGKKIVI
jgi:hypothetical protein